MTCQEPFRPQGQFNSSPDIIFPLSGLKLPPGVRINGPRPDRRLTPDSHLTSDPPIVLSAFQDKQTGGL